MPNPYLPQISSYLLYYLVLKNTCDILNCSLNVFYLIGYFQNLSNGAHVCACIYQTNGTIPFIMFIIGAENCLRNICFKYMVTRTTL